MINHPIVVFIMIILWGKLIEKISSYIKGHVLTKEKPKKDHVIEEESSPLRKDIKEKEKKIEEMREELTHLLQEVEKVNSPQTFALYSKIQRKVNALKDKIEGSEDDLEKIKGENKNLKFAKKNPETNNKTHEIEENSFLDHEKKAKIIEVFLQIV